LQIAEVVGAVGGQGGVAIVAQVEQFLIAWKTGDDAAVGVEEAVEDELFLCVGQLLGRDKGMLPGQVGGSGGDGFQLPQQAGRQVEGGLDVGVVAQDGGHVDVVLGGVEAHPGASEDAGLRVLEVDRLVLVPDDSQVDRVVGRAGGGDGRWHCRWQGGRLVCWRGFVGGNGCVCRRGGRLGRGRRGLGGRGFRPLPAGDKEGQKRSQQKRLNDFTSHDSYSA